MRCTVLREEENEIFEERYTLAIDRIAGLTQEQSVPAPFLSFFRGTAEFLMMLDGVRTALKDGTADAYTLEEWQGLNHRLYEDILPENYGKSWCDPAYAVKMAGLPLGQLLSFLAAEERGVIVSVFEDRLEETDALLEIFLQVYGIFEDAKSEGLFAPEDSGSVFADARAEGDLAKSVREALYWFASDYTEVFLRNRTLDMILPDRSILGDLAEKSDLSDLRYLYRSGEYIGGNALSSARCLNSLPEETIRKMADTFSEGYRIGFVHGHKPLEKKRAVDIRYHLGFERMIREASASFAKMGDQAHGGLRATYNRYAHSALTGRSVFHNGVTGDNPNPQFDYDHREDDALFFDRKYVERRLEVLRDTYEEYRETAACYAGPAVQETFGERPFEPVVKEEALKLSPKQRELKVMFSSEAGRITQKYIIGSERSFTIIDFPVPEIGIGENSQFDKQRYENIFAETIRVNTLDNQLYQKIQQTIIDVLDKGTRAHILGRGENRTDLTVQFHPLTDPAKQTVFENCVADVNIPVGEVFTSPQLKGTNGILHVSQVFLSGLNFRDLRIRFEDGMMREWSCSNFDDPDRNDAYIRENILFNHDTLPMGEFAIGTNTTAYRMARRYGIGALMPILIAEKTGPHFAVGDTCYSWEEDTPVYNPDGKEIVARDNEVSLLRRTEPEKAYFNCHTDITVSYEELGLIEVLGDDGYRCEIIRDGRFVLPGTEELNKALDEID